MVNFVLCEYSKFLMKFNNLNNNNFFKEMEWKNQQLLTWPEANHKQTQRKQNDHQTDENI